MTRTHKVSKARIFLTVACLFIFCALICLADRCTTSTDLEYVNPAFVSNWTKGVAINLDAMSISMDETTDLAVVQYIVQDWDSLESIATEFWTTVSNLKKINWISSIKPGQKIVVTNEEDGILYKVREKQNIKVFANKYGLDLQDLMTMNYITDDSEILYEWQEIFINLSEEKANSIPWFIDKAQPDLTIPKPKPVVNKKPATNKTNTTPSKNNLFLILTFYVWTARICLIFRNTVQHGTNRFYFKCRWALVWIYYQLWYMGLCNLIFNYFCRNWFSGYAIFTRR